jgi:hypothetical protein
MEVAIQIEKEAKNLIIFVENTYGDEDTFKVKNPVLHNLLQVYGETILKMLPTSPEA